MGAAIYETTSASNYIPVSLPGQMLLTGEMHESDVGNKVIPGEIPAAGVSGCMSKSLDRSQSISIDPDPIIAFYRDVANGVERAGRIPLRCIFDCIIRDPRQWDCWTQAVDNVATFLNKHGKSVFPAMYNPNQPANMQVGKFLDCGTLSKMNKVDRFFALE